MTHNSESIEFSAHAVAAALTKMAEEAARSSVSHSTRARLGETLQQYGEAIVFTLRKELSA